MQKYEWYGGDIWDVFTVVLLMDVTQADCQPCRELEERDPTSPDAVRPMIESSSLLTFLQIVQPN